MIFDGFLFSNSALLRLNPDDRQGMGRHRIAERFLHLDTRLCRNHGGRFTRFILGLGIPGQHRERGFRADAFERIEVNVCFPLPSVHVDEFHDDVACMAVPDARVI